MVCFGNLLRDLRPMLNFVGMFATNASSLGMLTGASSLDGDLNVNDVNGPSGLGTFSFPGSGPLMAKAVVVRYSSFVTGSLQVHAW